MKLMIFWFYEIDDFLVEILYNVIAFLVFGYNFISFFNINLDYFFIFF